MLGSGRELIALDMLTRCFVDPDHILLETLVAGGAMSGRKGENWEGHTAVARNESSKGSHFPPGKAVYTRSVPWMVCTISSLYLAGMTSE